MQQLKNVLWRGGGGVREDPPTLLLGGGEAGGAPLKIFGTSPSHFPQSQITLHNPSRYVLVEVIHSLV